MNLGMWPSGPSSLFSSYLCGQINVFYTTRRILSFFKALKYVLLLGSVSFLHNLAFCEEVFNPNENLQISASASIQENAQSDGTHFWNVEKDALQKHSLQPSSAAAYQPSQVSLETNIVYNKFWKLNFQLDYAHQLPIQLSLYPTEREAKKLNISDLYISFPMPGQNFSFWAGRRSFQFPVISLLALPNPLDQINLQGLGIESENFQISVSVSQGNVSTISSDKTDQIIFDPAGNPVLYSYQEYIATLFLSGKILLSEGRLFEPIFAMRYFNGNNKSAQTAEDGSYKTYAIKRSSAFIVGGVFSRPISNGFSGHTTVWFESLPSDKIIMPGSIQTLDSFDGLGRIPSVYPRNTIGFTDASEIEIEDFGGLRTAIFATHNSYAQPLAKLTPNSSETSLIPEGDATNKQNNRLSIDLQPIYFINSSVHAGIDLNFNYVAPKLMLDDVNSFIVSPLIRYATDKKLDSKNYVYVSVSYGIYDWKIKKQSDGTATDKLLSAQAGINVTI